MLLYRPLLRFCSPACRRLLFPLLYTEMGRRPFSACNNGNRRRLHAGNVFVNVKIKKKVTHLNSLPKSNFQQSVT